MKWICCQLGAREHFAVPRALGSENKLALLLTDAWADGRLPWRMCGGSAAKERFDPQIPSSLVKSFDWGRLTFELKAGRRPSGWDLTVPRNDWFQARVVRVLRNFARWNPGRRFTLFSYSYTARRPFEFAKQAGWETVLGQIDPGPFEEKLVARLHESVPDAGAATPAPPKYWEQWREECRLADRVVVNSRWSCQGLCSQGIPQEKIRVVPLVYDAPDSAAGFTRAYPSNFSPTRPLRVLFLGQVNLRKGAAEIFEAIHLLEKLSVEIWMVGPAQVPIPQRIREHPKMKWLGQVPRGMTARYYRETDVFLFPTHSDGFGLTQLEAQAWKLPIIASQNCGDVVRHLDNGYILPCITGSAIAGAIETLLAKPALLESMAAASRAGDFRTDCLPRLLEAATVPMGADRHAL